MKKLLNELSWLSPVQLFMLACLVALVVWGFVVLLFLLEA